MALHVDVERVPQVAGRVVGRDVEHLEVGAGRPRSRGSRGRRTRTGRRSRRSRPSTTMLGWRCRAGSGRPGVVTSWPRRRAVAVERRAAQLRARARRVPPRSRPGPRWRPHRPRGRSSAGSPPIPRRTVVRRPFLPRTSSSSASRAATSALAAIDARASSRSVSRSRVRSARSTSVLPCRGLESGALERRRRRGPGGGLAVGRWPAGVRRSSRARRSCQRSPRPGWPGRPGSCGRSRRRPS